MPDIKYLNYLLTVTDVRITHVVTKDSTIDLIKDYITYARLNRCQFTLKQLVGYDDDGNYDKFKKMFPDVFCLDAGDYNICYMPNNTISDNFMME